jgi:hypothetical protein
LGRDLDSASYQAGVVEIGLPPIAAVAEGLQVRKVVQAPFAARGYVIHLEKRVARASAAQQALAVALEHLISP